MMTFTGRRTSAVDDDCFPFGAKTTSIFEVCADGTVTEGCNKDVVLRAAAGESRIFAVWPGQWRSDLFWVDDLVPLARRYGLGGDGKPLVPNPHQHDVEWSVDPRYGNRQTSRVCFTLKCGCRPGEQTEGFEAQMTSRFGFRFATGGGSNWGPDRFTEISRRAFNRSIKEAQAKADQPNVAEISTMR